MIQKRQNHRGGNQLVAEKKEQKARRGSEKGGMRSEREIHEEIGKHLIDVIGGISE